MNRVKTARRTFLRHSFAVAAALPLGAIPLVARTDDSRVNEDDPAAVALGYKHDAVTVDATAYPRYAAGQLCENCALYQPGTEGWGACGVFPGKQVNAKGWCNAYAPKQA